MSERDVALAYDAIAETYDEAMQGDIWMRHRLWQHFDRVFKAGDRILDLACGTGADALYLASLGAHVVAIDASPGMIAQLQHKIGSGDEARCHQSPAGLATGARASRPRVSGRRLARAPSAGPHIGWDAAPTPLIEARVLRVADIASWPAETFDGAISSFAGLSTDADLVTTAFNVSRVLRPGAHFVVHLLNRFSLWEWIGAVARREWTAAAAVGRNDVRGFTIGGHSVLHNVYDPDVTYARYFARWFSLREAYGLGVLRPPHTVRRVPLAVVSALEQIERAFGSTPLLRGGGRFFVLDLERR
jgi:SAM-dependent methyltransferase